MDESSPGEDEVCPRGRFIMWAGKRRPRRMMEVHVLVPKFVCSDAGLELLVRTYLTCKTS
jgi:hypothetical protein